MTITRRRHPLQDLSLRVLGGMRRHGVMELLLELPDGKSLVPARWTDVGRVAGEGDAGAATLGSLVDLLHVCELIAELRGQAAGMSPARRTPMQPVQLSLIPDPVLASSTDPALRRHRHRHRRSTTCPPTRPKRRSWSSQPESVGTHRSRPTSARFEPIQI